MSIDIRGVLSDFQRTLPLAGIDANSVQLDVQDRGCPHIPPALPPGKMAVYIFVLGDRVLKVGKVGPNSNSRFQTHHYVPWSSGSNLAKSLLDDETGDCHDISVDEIGSWMRQHLHRIDVLLSARVGVAVLAYLEAFLHCRLSPLYEGFKGQKANQSVGRT
jgi:hypothetical protein